MIFTSVQKQKHTLFTNNSNNNNNNDKGSHVSRWQINFGVVVIVVLTRFSNSVTMINDH